MIDTSECMTHSMQRKMIFGKKAQEEKKQVMNCGRNEDLSCPSTATSSLLLED